jgi:hypothetical protein
LKLVTKRQMKQLWRNTGHPEDSNYQWNVKQRPYEYANTLSNVNWTFGFHEMLGSSWVAAQSVASQEGLSSMSEWVRRRSHDWIPTYKICFWKTAAWLIMHLESNVMITAILLKPMSSWPWRSTSSNKTGCVLSRKSMYWIPPRVCYHMLFKQINIYNCGPNIDAKCLLKLRPLSIIRILQWLFIGHGDCLLQCSWMLLHQSTIHGTRSRVHLEFCAEANRIGGNNSCFLAAALV